jgi:hypothetical protein
MNNMPGVKYTVPFRLMDSTNARSTKGPAITNSYDYRSAWLKLWGKK